MIALLQMSIFFGQAPKYLESHTFTLGRLYASLSLGAVYQSRAQCSIVPIEINRAQTRCEGDGQMVIQEIIDVGVIGRNKGTCYIDRNNITTVNDYSSEACFNEFRYDDAMK